MFSLRQSVLPSICFNIYVYGSTSTLWPCFISHSFPQICALRVCQDRPILGGFLYIFTKKATRFKSWGFYASWRESTRLIIFGLLGEWVTHTFRIKYWRVQRDVFKRKRGIEHKMYCPEFIRIPRASRCSLLQWPWF